MRLNLVFSEKRLTIDSKSNGELSMLSGRTGSMESLQRYTGNIACMIYYLS